MSTTTHMGPTNVGVGAVKTDKWKVSPSQVNTWRECPRKWGYRYIEGIDTPPGKGALLGSATHNVLEKYFGSDMDMSDDPKAYMKDQPMRLAQSMLELLPDVDRVIATEEKFHFTWDGVLYRGIIDLQWTEGMFYFISDHKTSSDPVKYGLSDEDLLDDVQAVTYAVFGLARNNATTIGLQWTYVNTRGKPRPFARRNTLHITDAHATFERIVHPIGLKIVDAIATVDKAADLEANPLSCGNFGGCPHAAYCPRTFDETLTAALGPSTGKSMGNLAALIAKSKNAGAAPLKDRGAERERNESGEPGLDVNSPEAPANSDVARTVSQAVGAVGGTKKEQKSGIAGLVAAAAGATTSDEAQERIDESTPDPTEAPVGAPEGWDPTTTPSQDQLLAWVATSTFHDFASTKDKATPERPFAHGRTLAAMDKSKIIFVQKLDGYRRCLITDTGKKRWETLDKANVWVSPRTDTPEVPANTPGDEEEITVTTTTQMVAGLAVVGTIKDGKLSLVIDLGQFA